MTVLFPALGSAIRGFEGEFDRIEPARRETLGQLAVYVHGSLERAGHAKLVFICTHNSRRSHTAALWAGAAAAHYEISPVATYSGGTEITAFAPPAVAALRRVGFTIDAPETQEANPAYRVTWGPGLPATEARSKKFGDQPNPSKGFCAVMTCSSADEACPLVPGADLRLALPYTDPKAWDGTAEEAPRYDACCRQIGRELCFAFSRLKGASS